MNSDITCWRNVFLFCRGLVYSNCPLCMGYDGYNDNDYRGLFMFSTSAFFAPLKRWTGISQVNEVYSFYVID